MKYPALLLSALRPLVACAQGENGDSIDAPATAVDATTDGTPAVDAPAVDAPAVDAATIDAPTVDAPAVDAPAVDAGTTGTVDTCAQASDITAAASAGTGVTLSGDLTGYANDIQPASSCTGFTNDGPDAVYALTLTAGKTITASVNATWDSAVEIIQPCALTPTCLIGRDAGNPESVTYTTTAAGTFYVIVDSWDPGAFGPYTLTVRVQ